MVLELQPSPQQGEQGLAEVLISLPLIPNLPLFSVAGHTRIQPGQVGVIVPDAECDAWFAHLGLAAASPCYVQPGSLPLRTRKRARLSWRRFGMSCTRAPRPSSAVGAQGGLAAARAPSAVASSLQAWHQCAPAPRWLQTLAQPCARHTVPLPPRRSYLRDNVLLHQLLAARSPSQLQQLLADLRSSGRLRLLAAARACTAVAVEVGEQPARCPVLPAGGCGL